MREIDIAFLYEHAARELDVACAVAAILRQQRVAVEILQWPTSFFEAAGKFKPKVVVLPFCYTERSFLPLLQYWSRSIFFNMTWEQLFYSGNQLAKTPRGEFSVQHVIHHSWSEAYSDLLRTQDIPEGHIFTNGHPAYALYDAPYCNYFLSRTDLAQRYDLDITKKWIFFPENYNWIFYTEATIERFLEAGQSTHDIEVMKQFCSLSLTEVLHWCRDVADRGDVELVVRPRPATHLDDFKAFADRVLDHFPSSLRFIQAESVREWILAADVVVSSHSTSLIEAAVAGKPAFMLAPFPMPAVLHVDWHDLLPRIITEEAFFEICHREGSVNFDHRLADWARGTLMSNGDSILNLADMLEGLRTGRVTRPPSISRRQYATVAKQIIPEWLWMKYHQWRGMNTAIPEEYKKDIVDPVEMEARIRKWQNIMADSRKQEVELMVNALITGISGFVGPHLAESLRGEGWTVYGFDQRSSGDGNNIFVGDLTDRPALQNVLRECRPDVIFHLAGLIKSDQPEMLYNANLLATVALFDALLEIGQRPGVILASSSAVYGSGRGGRPISEKFKPRPMTHYAVSKLAQEIAALRYFDAFDLRVMIVRMFNLIGPGQSPDLACSAFARQIALAERNGEGEIVTGDLGARRDFVDVRDAARAIVMAAGKGRAGQIYNVCSGRAVLMRKCLEDMLSMSRRQFKVRVDAGKIQKNDVPIQVGNAGKLNQLTGWRPQISLKQSLADLLDYWRDKVKSGLE